MKTFNVVKVLKILIINLLIVAIILLATLSGIVVYRNREFKKTLDLPMVYISTESEKEVVSKEEYLNCEISISNTEKKYELNKQSGRIKGRGNSTWDMYNKKPYKIKFDEKVDLFGNGKAKEWTFIANHGDQSLMRNALAYKVASVLDDLKFTTTTQFVDLYVNDEYRGMYLVCEQTEVGKNRVDIEEDLSVADSGYLIELDFRALEEGVEGRDWFYSNNQPFAIKSPDTEDELFTSAHVDFIKGYLDACFSALKSGNYEQVASLIDVNSFADSYILNELFKSTDVFQSSFYMYKDKGGKLCSGPVWDYDLSSGNCMYNNGSTKTDNLYAKRNSFYKELLNFNEFNLLVKEKLNASKDMILNTIESELDYAKENYSRSAKRNFLKWDILGKYVWGNSKKVASIKTWNGQLEYLEQWLNDSLDYMIEVYC